VRAPRAVYKRIPLTKPQFLPPIPLGVFKLAAARLLRVLLASHVCLLLLCLSLAMGQSEDESQVGRPLIRVSSCRRALRHTRTSRLGHSPPSLPYLHVHVVSLAELGKLGPISDHPGPSCAWA
jgi:hypothetical protein